VKVKRAGVVRKLDKTWADLIKKDERCEVCGSINGLNAHHWYKKRKAYATRWELDNGISLCISCHFEAHQSPGRFMARLEAVWGKEKVDRISHDLEHKLQDPRPIKTFELEQLYDVLKGMADE